MVAGSHSDIWTVFLLGASQGKRGTYTHTESGSWASHLQQEPSKPEVQGKGLESYALATQQVCDVMQKLPEGSSVTLK